jgi:anti-sigma factor RsiW
MTHPDDLLAEYVDGALADGERADLERHLARCARCRDEVELARAARAALAEVPLADPPADIGGPAIAAARRGRSGRSPVWYRWAGIAAGVAAAVLVATLVLPKIGSGTGRTEAGVARPAEATAGPASAVPPATTIESQDAEYDAASVQRLAAEYTGQRVAFAATDAVTGAPAPEASGSTAFRMATTCLQRAASGGQGELIRLIRARYEGASAFFGVYLTGPGVGQAADGVRVLVVPVDACSRILTSTWSKI